MSPKELRGERHRDPTLNNPTLVCQVLCSSMYRSDHPGKAFDPKKREGKAVLAWDPAEGRLPVTADSYPRQQWVHLWLCESFWWKIWDFQAGFLAEVLRFKPHLGGLKCQTCH